MLIFSIMSFVACEINNMIIEDKENENHIEINNKYSVRTATGGLINTIMIILTGCNYYYNYVYYI